MARAVLLGAACVLVLAMCFSPARTTPASRKSLRSVDCRRLVFHPYCRGVAAKRSMPSAESRFLDAVDLDAAPPPPSARGPLGSLASELRADPLLVGILGRLAEEGREQQREQRDRPRLVVADVAADSADSADSQASDADAPWSGEPSGAKAPDYGRFEWQSARKRMKEQEITYDY